MRVSTKDGKTLFLSAPRYAFMNMAEVDRIALELGQYVLEKHQRNSACSFISELPKIYDGKYLLILGKKEEVGSLSADQVERLLKDRGLAYFTARAQEWARTMKIPYPLAFRIRTMGTRFGVNSISKHIITFSTISICYSPEIVDSLIVHELAHCFAPGHQKDFYAIVNKYDPEYKIHSKKLKKGIYA